MAIKASNVCKAIPAEERAALFVNDKTATCVSTIMSSGKSDLAPDGMTNKAYFNKLAAKVGATAGEIAGAYHNMLVQPNYFLDNRGGQGKLTLLDSATLSPDKLKTSDLKKFRSLDDMTAYIRIVGNSSNPIGQLDDGGKYGKSDARGDLIRGTNRKIDKLQVQLETTTLTPQKKTASEERLYEMQLLRGLVAQDVHGKNEIGITVKTVQGQSIRSPELEAATGASGVEPATYKSSLLHGKDFSGVAFGAHYAREVWRPALNGSVRFLLEGDINKMVIRYDNYDRQGNFWEMSAGAGFLYGHDIAHTDQGILSIEAKATAVLQKRGWELDGDADKGLSGGGVAGQNSFLQFSDNKYSGNFFGVGAGAGACWTFLNGLGLCAGLDYRHLVSSEQQDTIERDGKSQVINYETSGIIDRVGGTVDLKVKF